MDKKIFGGLLLIIALIIAGTVAYKNSHKRQQPLVFSPDLMLNSLWANYKNEYWESSSGRTLDKQRGGITTSEGQSYALLRSVWLDDKPTFDTSLTWLNSSLNRPNDKLFSWLYGKKNDGSYGILTDQGGQNTASDADTDIAMALLFATARWGDTKYLNQAQGIIQDIWNQEVVTIKNQPYLAANNLEKNSPTQIIVNPSYCAPYAYRMFAQVDTQHNWAGVVDTCYQIITKSSNLPLDKTATIGLPPDWVTINRSTGELTAPTAKNLDTNYSFDAMRIPWRLALDWKWYGDPRAKATLDKFFFLQQQWKNYKALYPAYSHDGNILIETESPAMYGTSLGYFLTSNSSEAANVYNNKLRSLYNPDQPGWKEPLSYYDDNWAWFGLALYHNFTTNLFQNYISTHPNINH